MNQFFLNVYQSCRYVRNAFISKQQLDSSVKYDCDHGK